MHVYPQINNEPRNNSDSKIQPNQTWCKEDLYWMVAELGFTRQTKLVVDCTCVVHVLVELVGDIQAVTEHDHPWKCTKQTVSASTSYRMVYRFLGILLCVEKLVCVAIPFFSTLV